MEDAMLHGCGPPPGGRPRRAGGSSFYAMRSMLCACWLSQLLPCAGSPAVEGGAGWGRCTTFPTPVHLPLTLCCSTPPPPHGSCIPAIIVDEVDVSFESIIDLSAFTVRIPQKDAERLPEILLAIPPEQRAELQRNLARVWQR